MASRRRGAFGREFVDGTAPGLFAVATARSRIAAAKITVLLCWGVAVVALTVLLALLVGLALGLGPLSSSGWEIISRMLDGGLLVVVLCVPFALVASSRRGYLPGFVALLLVIAAAQIVTTAGAGAWFPWATPSLWLGMGGPDAAEAVTPVHLVLPLVVGGFGSWAILRWWVRAEVVEAGTAQQHGVHPGGRHNPSSRRTVLFRPRAAHRQPVTQASASPRPWSDCRCGRSGLV